MSVQMWEAVKASAQLGVQSVQRACAKLDACVCSNVGLSSAWCPCCFQLAGLGRYVRSAGVAGQACFRAGATLATCASFVVALRACFLPLRS